MLTLGLNKQKVVTGKSSVLTSGHDNAKMQIARYGATANCVNAVRKIHKQH